MPRPLADLDTAPFWEGVRARQFLLPTCTDCGTRRWPPGPMCPACQQMGTVWLNAPRQGHVYSWVVVTHPVHPVMVEQVPYVAALVDLGGVRVLGNVIGCAPDDLAEGLPVEIVFEEADHGFILPNFRPVGSSHDRQELSAAP